MKKKVTIKYERKGLRHKRPSKTSNIQLTGVRTTKMEGRENGRQNYLSEILAELMQTNLQN